MFNSKGSTKVIFAVMLIASMIFLYVILFAQDNKMTGITVYPVDRAASMQMGYNSYDFLNASSEDATPTAGFENCRGILADSSGVVKIDYTNSDGGTVTEVKQLNGGTIMPVRNVTKLYRYTTGTTAGTAKSFTSAGASTNNAIKLVR